MKLLVFEALLPPSLLVRRIALSIYVHYPLDLRASQTKNSNHSFTRGCYVMKLLEIKALLPHSLLVRSVALSHYVRYPLDLRPLEARHETCVSLTGVVV